MWFVEQFNTKLDYILLDSQQTDFDFVDLENDVSNHTCDL